MSQDSLKESSGSVSPGRRRAQRKIRRMEKRKRKGRGRRRGGIGLVPEVIVAAVLAAALVYFGAYRVTVSGSSMEPALSADQQLLVNRLIYHISVPEKGDIIVFSLSGNKTDRSSFSVKRVIGEPGDVITISDGSLYINDQLYECDEEIDDAGISEEGLTVPADCYFVLGDHPAGSTDSRFSNIGCISTDKIVGKVWLRISPKDAFGIIK